MTMETILEECGGFGKFQVMYLFGICIQRLTAGWSMLQMSYAGYIPDWYCLVGNASHQHPVNRSLLTDQNFEKCQLNNSDTGYKWADCNSHYFEGESDTIVSEWDLVCDRSWIKATITSVQMVGVLVGAVASGQCSDTFGRKKTLFGFSLFHAMLNFGAAFSTSWEMFAVFRFFLGTGIGAIIVVTTPYVMELLPMKWRPLASVIPVWALGVCVFSLASFLLDNWSYLHIACGAFGLPCLLCYLFVPESVRWLTLKGRLKEAEAVVERMASINGTNLTCDVQALLEKIHEGEKDSRSDGKQYSYWDLFKGRKEIKLSLIACYNWCMISLVYYGISFGVSALAGSLYLNIFILAAVEIPSTIASAFFNNKIGRKKTYIAYSIVTAVFSLGCLVVQFAVTSDSRGSMVTGFSLTAKMGLGAAWAVLALWCNELFPTCVRSLGFGMVNSAARIGGIIAPFLIDLDHQQVMSYSIITGLVVISIGLSLFNPETKGTQLADSLQQTSAAEVTVAAGSDDFEKPTSSSTVVSTTSNDRRTKNAKSKPKAMYGTINNGS